MDGQFGQSSADANIASDECQARKRLGDSLLQEGKTQQAIDEFSQAITLDPRWASAHNGLGLAYLRAGRLADAMASFRKASQLQPNSPYILVNLANTLKGAGLLNDAIAAYRSALAINDRLAGAFSGLGHALQILGQLDDAADCLNKAVTIDPDFAEAQLSLASLLLDREKFERALACCDHALKKMPGHAEWTKARIYASQGLTDEADFCARAAIDSSPRDAAIHSGYLFLLNSNPKTERESIAREHAQWALRHGQHCYPKDKHHRNRPEAGRRIRLGYVSANLHNHAAMRVFLPILCHHNRENFETFCYSQTSKTDAVSRKLRDNADHWREIADCGDDQVAMQIEEDRIDLLIDLSGHMLGNRLLIFARKPAPVQISYWVYNNTTGLKTMDYRLTDSRQDPVGQSEGYYCEKLIRLEPLSWCYLPWNEMPIRQSPLLRNGYVTFGSLNHPMKMNDEVISVWARILREVDQSQLVFRSRDADASGDRIVDRFVSYGIGPERLRPIGRQSLQKYLDCLSQVDVALDPFPYNGHVTSCDTLWMGVPLVTLIGRQAVSRIGADILANLEMNDLIAPNREDYVRTAVELARDGSRLDSLRSILRERMRASAIMDYPSLVERLERALRELWQTWCASPAGAQRTGSYR